MTARTLMLQGTGSDVGKSLIVAGLCRALTMRGLAVRPFKPQNMSNNAAVTADGGEIGRAQALQARAARVASSTDMNPVLLKPQSEIGAQVIVQGRIIGNAGARDYQAMKPGLMPAVLESYRRLAATADIVVVEGAGSASEINLRPGDIANMGFARAVDAPVILVGDIDRGGVIAQILGTKVALEEADAALVQGFIVNKMRGDASLFADGMRLIAERSFWRPIGLLPFFPEAGRLPPEDAMALPRYGAELRPGAACRIAVPVLPRIANFDDLDPLRLEPAVELVMVRQGHPLPVCDLVILPGSKATIADLAAFRAEGWDIDLAAHRRRGGLILGLCGGYQMLGRSIADPGAMEGPATRVEGLGLLEVDTVLSPAKRLTVAKGISLSDGAPVAGYEMHIGVTAGAGTARPMLRLEGGREDGAVSPDGGVMGCYLHGLFADDRQRAAWLARLGAAGDPAAPGYEATVEAVLDGLAGHLERHLDIEALLSIAR